MTNQTEPTNYRGYTLFVHPEWTEFGNRICFIQIGGLTVDKTIALSPNEATEKAKAIIDHTLGPLNKYGLLDALNDLSDIQFVDNTWDEGQIAKAEVVKIIKALCQEMETK